MPFFAAPPTTPASLRPLTVRRHIAEAKAAVAPVRHRFPANHAGDPRDLDVDHLEANFEFETNFSYQKVRKNTNPLTKF